METVSITYERLFNLGNYDHETFKIERHVQATSKFIALKNMALEMAALEDDLRRYREIHNIIENLGEQLQSGYFSDIKAKAAAELELNSYKKQAEAFREMHFPNNPSCKCAFCEGKKK